MEYSKNYSLLRPFDLEAAKRGEKLCNTTENYQYLFLGYGRKSGAEAVASIILNESNEMFISEVEFLKMAPLAWVEGKPVYKGDVLYYKNCKETATVIDWNGSRLGVKTTESGICGEVPEILTWQKPKTKKKVFVNLYKDQEEASVWGYWHDSKDDAVAAAGSDALACVEIEIDEENTPC